MTRRRLLVAIAVAAALIAPAGTVHADPAVPTDFSTVVLGVEPATPSLSVDVVGGDSFVELTVERGTDVVVLGYWGEPYLHFHPDGRVDVNQLSPTRAQNEDRYGTAASTAANDVDREQWAEVATDGSYAWHDHRAHWMSQDPPPGHQRGDRVQEDEILLEVDGEPVSIAVAVDWEPEPSRVPVAAGALVAGFALLIALSQRHRVAWVAAAIGLGAAAIGWGQVTSVPPETGPSSINWLLPAIAAASALVALTLGRSLFSYGLVVLAGIQLALWTFLRRDVLTRSLLPTDAPFWLDRGVTAAAGVVGVVAVAAGVLGLFRLPFPEP